MKHLIIAILLCFTIIGTSLYSQEIDSKNSLDDISLDTIDDLFNDEPESTEITDENPSEIEKDPSLEEIDQSDDLALLKELTAQTGGTFKVSYAFAAGIAPGWSEAPWFWEDEDEQFTKVVGADLRSDFIFDFQLSPQLRAYQSFSCDSTAYNFILDTFWGEYNWENLLFFKLGYYSESWGQNGNFGYTNLLTRLPANGSGGGAYTFRVNVPLGVGGLQFLTMTRSGWVESGNIEDMQISDLGYGVKYNFAHPMADINLGLFYQDLMPIRAIGSVKTTLFDSTEVYTEGLAVLPKDDYYEKTVYSFSLGMVDDFFKDSLTLNLEYFFNGEVYTNVVETDSGWTEDEVSPFIKGHNAAFNLYYNTGFHHVNLFSRFVYNMNENSGKWAPGIRYNPYDDLSVFLSVPIALGDRDGSYYISNFDEKNRPFSVTLAVKLSGRQKFAQYK